MTVPKNTYFEYKVYLLHVNHKNNDYIFAYTSSPYVHTGIDRNIELARDKVVLHLVQLIHENKSKLGEPGVENLWNSSKAEEQEIIIHYQETVYVLNVKEDIDDKTPPKGLEVTESD